MSAPSYADLEPRMQAHLDALGFHSVGSYRIWCHRQGLDKGLTKTADEMIAETALRGDQRAKAPPSPTPGHRPGTARSITRVHSGRHGIWTPLNDLSGATRDQEERDALHRLLIHLEKYAKLSWEGAARLTRHHKEWLRPPEDWYPESPKGEIQIGELANHLLARYPVPLFMGRAWLDDGPSAERCRRWFLHIGAGGSVRSLDSEIHITRRMAHLFRHAPGNLTIPMALRWAQCVGMGGRPRLAHDLARSRLRYFVEDEPFWTTVVRFFVSHPMLAPGQVGPIVDYVYNQKFLPREAAGPDGAIIRGAPARPDLVMKRRSIDKLLRRVEEWHRALAEHKRERWVEWKSGGIGGFACDEQDVETGETLHWRIVELLNTRDLAREGSTLHHCIYSYQDRCASGDFSVFSVQAQAADDRPMQVMTIAVENGERMVTEYRGKYNLRPNEARPPSRKRALRQGCLRLLNLSQGVMAQWVEEQRLRSSR